MKGNKHQLGYSPRHFGMALLWNGVRCCEGQGGHTVAAVVLLWNHVRFLSAQGPLEIRKLSDIPGGKIGGKLC